MNNRIFWLRVTWIIIIAVMTLCYIFGDVIQSWRNWFSGLAYGVAICSFASTFERRRWKGNS